MAASEPDIVRRDADVVEFGEFRLDRPRRLLTKEGKPVLLGDRAFDVLVVLLRHSPAIVSKATLLAEAWPGAIVGEGVLRTHLHLLRKALGGDKDRARFISTVSGRGYCFFAPLLRSSTFEAAGGDVASGSASPDTNLPMRISNIIGRERALADLGKLLKQGRFITIVGPGGVGKTRLAVELGWRALGDYEGGIWLIDLAPLADPDAVTGAVAATLGLTLTSTKATVGSIVAAVGKSQQLLIFDNCEHMVEPSVALIKTLLERAPSISILATSRKSFHFAAEQVYGLDPLATPPADAVKIGGFAAVQLFVERARATDRTFALHGGDIAGVGEICRQLDGLPLAIEMAAGRVRMLGVEALHRGLGDRLRNLKGSPGGGARHASLRGMLEWSHSLLAPIDQSLFRRLSVFPGSFSLDAAVAVAGADDSERWTRIDALGQLIDNSLVALERREPPRYRLLETMRLYAAEKLREAGEKDTAAELHAHHLIAVFEEAEREWEDTPDPVWIARYQPELDNLRAALDWALEAPERGQIALALAGRGLRLLRWLYLVGDGLKYQERVLALVGADTSSATIARVLRHASGFYVSVRDPRGLVTAVRWAGLCRELDDRQGLADALLTIVQYKNWEGQHIEAIGLVAQVESLLRERTYKKSQLRLAIAAGMTSYYIRDFSGARRYFLEAAETAKAQKSGQQVDVIFNLALLEYGCGDIDRAIELSIVALGLTGSWRGHAYRGRILTNLGLYQIAQGGVADGRLRLEEAFPIMVESRNVAASDLLQPWAVLFGMEGRLAEAAQLIGAADADRARRGHPIQPSERSLYDRLIGILKAGLPQAEFSRCIARGAAWSTAEAIEFVANRLLHAPVYEVATP